jgi:hypothetical protein
MDAFHERLARVGLSVLGDFGFALAGGYAVQAHGLVERPSEDVDPFATLAAEKAFPTPFEQPSTHTEPMGSMSTSSSRIAASPA